MRVVVLGGAGTLGRAVVAALSGRGVEAVAASRRTGVDLLTGAGLATVLSGADAVVNAVTSPRHPRQVDVGGTERVVAALRAAAGSAHLVQVSIVGCDASSFAYYKIKTDAEHRVRDGGIPATIVRATQFHPFVAAIARRARPLGVGVTVRGVAAQPCDVSWAAEQLADVATGAPPAGVVRAPDLAGPELVGLGDAVRRVAEHDGVRLRGLVTLPALGGTARAFAAGTNLPGPDARTGGRSFADWLAEQA